MATNSGTSILIDSLHVFYDPSSNLKAHPIMMLALVIDYLAASFSHPQMNDNTAAITDGVAAVVLGTQEPPTVTKGSAALVERDVMPPKMDTFIATPLLPQSAECAQAESIGDIDLEKKGCPSCTNQTNIVVTEETSTDLEQCLHWQQQKIKDFVPKAIQDCTIVRLLHFLKEEHEEIAGDTFVMKVRSSCPE